MWPDSAIEPKFQPLRLQPGCDLRREIERAASALPGQSGFVLSGIGSLTQASLRFAGAESSTLLVEPLEVLSLAGSITAQGAHVHASVSTASGSVVGGHLGYGCLVRTTAEVLVAALPEWRLSREHDSASGYEELTITRRSDIIGPGVDRESECEAVLRTLPEWFGIETALRRYARDSATLPTFALVEEDAVIGFLTLQEHFASSWEIHCVAIRADARGRGHGSRLLSSAEAWLIAKRVRYLQVKTVAPTSASLAYAQTREFYARRGFVPLEIFPTLWDAHNPALQCIKVLDGV